MHAIKRNSPEHGTGAWSAFPRLSFPVRLAVACFGLSVAAVLFSLSLFRLISFFVMPSLFFDLLLVGFPLGAALVSPLRGDAVVRFRLALPWLQGVMVASVLVTLALKHADYMRENLLFHVNPVRLLLQILIFSLLYLPFFAAYGASEYLAYLAGVDTFQRRMRGVYALFLFGGAAAFGLTELLLPALGITGLLTLSLGLTTLSRILVAAHWRWQWGLELLLLAGLLAWPGADRMFMKSFKSSKQASLAEQQKRGPSRVLHSGWGRYAYVEVLQLHSPSGLLNVGFYNDVSQWVYPLGSAAQQEFREVTLSPFVEGASHVAIIGGGGGRDIKLARAAGVPHIVAIELEPMVPRAVQGNLARYFERIYDEPGVEVVIGEARHYFERSSQEFDVLFFWSVGGYPQLMLEPGNMVRTREALQTFVEHLSPRGLFVIGYDAELDPEKVLLRQYFATLSALGCEIAGFERGDQLNEYMLVATSPRVTDDRRAELARIRDRLPAPVRRIPQEELVLSDFSAVTDDRPYLAGNIRNILTPEHVWFLGLVLSVALAVIGTATVVALSVQRSRKGLPLSRAALCLAFLVGANFVAAQHLAVLEIFRHRYVYYDALVVGALAFLTVSGLGSLLLNLAWLRMAALGAILLAGACLAMGRSAPSPAALLALSGMTFAAGGFFPLLFDRFPDLRMHIFAMDALGAAAGSLVSFFVPICAGFTAFNQIALVLFMLTASAISAYCWKLKGYRTWTAG